jgi:DNA-binding winged helix-turn-helix (wHTH) protein
MHALASPIQQSASPILSWHRVESPRDIGGPIHFRDFTLLPRSRALLLDGSPVELGGRAFDLLLVLLRARGAIVGKEEIIRQVWPSTFVDEGNLRFQVTMLRKALGRDRDMIKTVTGRGYLLIDDSEAEPVRQPQHLLA